MWNWTLMSVKASNVHPHEHCIFFYKCLPSYYFSQKACPTDTAHPKAGTDCRARLWLFSCNTWSYSKRWSLWSLPHARKWGDVFCFSSSWCGSQQVRDPSRVLINFGTWHWMCCVHGVRNYALKILTACATSLNRQGRLQELKTLQDIAALLKSSNPAPFLPELVDHFETTGPHGDHLCFVLRLRSTDASSFRRTAPSRRLLLHDVKMIILHALYALKTIHGLGLIHTGISQYHVPYKIIINLIGQTSRPAICCSFQVLRRSSHRSLKAK